MTKEELIAGLNKLPGNPEIMFEHRMKTGYDEGEIRYAHIGRVLEVSARLHSASKIVSTVGIIIPSGHYIKVGGW
jgi:hypothetical protein